MPHGTATQFLGISYSEQQPRHHRTMPLCHEWHAGGNHALKSKGQKTKGTHETKEERPHNPQGPHDRSTQTQSRYSVSRRKNYIVWKRTRTCAIRLKTSRRSFPPSRAGIDSSAFCAISPLCYLYYLSIIKPVAQSIHTVNHAPHETSSEERTARDGQTETEGQTETQTRRPGRAAGRRAERGRSGHHFWPCRAVQGRAVGRGRQTLHVAGRNHKDRNGR
jgi:hypothetical protein